MHLRKILARRLGFLEGADARWSVISSVHDQLSHGNDELVDIALRAAERARNIHLEELQQRSPSDARWISTWPGEHYRLLTALVATMSPRHIIEIGTFKGQGALALAAGSSESTVLTYDIVPWQDIPGSALRPEDMNPHGQIEQRIGDLGDDHYRDTQIFSLREADLIFIDGPKDGTWEQQVIPKLLGQLSDRRRLIILDDIRLLTMVKLWRSLEHPKLDVTSLGHWSGSGLVLSR